MLGGEDEEFSIVPLLYPHVTLSISSIGSFSFVDSSSKPSHPSPILYLGALHIQYYSK